MDIQLDAKIEGMMLAAEICEHKKSGIFAEADRGISICKEAILTAIEKLRKD